MRKLEDRQSRVEDGPLESIVNMLGGPPESFRRSIAAKEASGNWTKEMKDVWSFPH